MLTFTSHAVGCGFAPQPGNTKNYKKNMVQVASLLGTHAFDSAAILSKRLGSVWNCQWGHGFKRSPEINRNSRVLFPGLGFLTSATWHLMPKKAL